MPLSYKDLIETENEENEILGDENFFEEVKRALNITWNDEDTDSSVKDYIRNGVAVLEDDVKKTINFKIDRIARKLLKTYCRYERNNSEEYFIENNLQDILKLEAKYGQEKV